MEWLSDKWVQKKLQHLPLLFHFAANKSKSSSESEPLTRTLRGNRLSHSLDR